MWWLPNWLSYGQKRKSVSRSLRYGILFNGKYLSCRGDDNSFKPIKDGKKFKPIGLGFGCQKTIDDDVVGPSAFEPIMNASVQFEQPRNLEDPSGRIIGGQKAVQHRSFVETCYRDRNLMYS